MAEDLKEISLKKEISGLALFISLPQLISSPLSVGLAKLIQTHSNIGFEIKEILDFLVISFPLTLAIAIIVLLIDERKVTLFSVTLTLVCAVIASNLLHKLFGSFPDISVKEALNNTFSNDPNSSKGNPIGDFIIAILGLYWKRFGAILFIQSCIIGIYAGLRLISIDKKKNTSSTSKVSPE